MRRRAGIIAGATVAAVTMAVASQTDLLSRTAVVNRQAVPEAAQPAVVEAPPLTPTPAAEAEIVRLTALLSERREAYDKAVRALEWQTGENGRLTALLAERDAELGDLRAELEKLRVEAALVAKNVAPLEGSQLNATVIPSSLTDGDAVPGDAGQPGRLTSVHFDPSSSKLSPGGQAHAAAAAVMLSDMKIARIKVIGYTDTTGNPARNRALAEARARAVADFLVRSGLPSDVIEVEGMGEEGAPVVTGDGVKEPLNRCAEIVAIPL